MKPAEELWHSLGHSESVCTAEWPSYNESYLAADTVTYPVSFNGKMRFTIELPLDATAESAMQVIKSMDEAQKWLDGKEPRKVIFVPKKIVNIVI